MRVLMMVAYAPALLFPDSWGYIAMAFTGHFVALPRLRPIGYSVLIRILSITGRSLAEIVTLQHLMGIAIGITIYVLLIRSRLPRWAAAAAAALVLLDGYTMTLEQYVMSDTLLTVLLVASAVVICWPWLGPGSSSHSTPTLSTRRAVAGGLLIALCSLVREVGPFVVPVFLIYMLWVRANWRSFVAFLLAAAIPLLAYSALIDQRYHVFGLTATSGWTLYGRVAGFANCTGVKLPAVERQLCETPAQRASHPRAPDWYIWGPSPAERAFHPDTESNLQAAVSNRELESFSRTMILQNPLGFVDATLSDFARYFEPDVTPYGDAVSATTLPRTAADEAHSPTTQRRDLPGLHLTVRSPAGFVRAYRSIIHVPRPALALLGLASLVALCLRVPARREILLFSGSGLLLLLGTAATGGFALRYLMPAVPLLAVGGAIAVAQLLPGSMRERRSAVRLHTYLSAARASAGSS